MPTSTRHYTVFVTILAMEVSLYLSRASLSVSMMAFLAATLVHKDIGAQWRSFTRSPLLVGMALLFMVPLVTGLWSADKETWMNVMRVKLPLLLFPVAFAGPWQLSPRQWRYTGYAFLLLLLVTSLGSFVFYLQNLQAIHEGYLKARVITTPLGDDHVRYSWLLACGALLCLLMVHKREEPKLTIFFVILGLWFTVFLHVLAARTGVLALYIVLLSYVAWMLFRRNTRLGLIGIGVLVLLPVVAWLALPTFQNRIHYFLYDVRHVKEQVYLPQSSDGNRMRSLKAGWHVLQQHLMGAGAGDVQQAANAWYEANVPGILPVDKIYPSSEWLVYGAMAGWMGVVVFTVVMLLPLAVPGIKHRFFWIMLNVITAFSFLFDIGLEVQYGAFLYVFLVLWWWKWLKQF
jgi:O-antigen ligase